MNNKLSLPDNLKSFSKQRNKSIALSRVYSTNYTPRLLMPTNIKHNFDICKPPNDIHPVAIPYFEKVFFTFFQKPPYNLNELREI